MELLHILTKKLFEKAIDNDMPQRRCFQCQRPTGLGLRHAGLRRDLPPDKRGYLPFCPDHEADAFARRDKATGKAPAPQQPAKAKAVRADPPDAAQKGLFD